MGAVDEGIVQPAAKAAETLSPRLHQLMVPGRPGTIARHHPPAQGESIQRAQLLLEEYLTVSPWNNEALGSLDLDDEV